MEHIASSRDVHQTPSHYLAATLADCDCGAMSVCHSYVYDILANASMVSDALQLLLRVCRCKVIKQRKGKKINFEGSQSKLNSARMLMERK